MIESHQINELVTRIKNGCQDSYTLLLSHYNSYLCNLGYRYFATYLDKEDIYQEGSIALYKAVCTYDNSKGEFTPYSYMVINSYLKNVVKKAFRQKHYILNNAVSLDRYIDIGEEERESFYKIMPSEELSPESICINNEHLQEWSTFYLLVLDLCSTKEAKVLDNYLKGYSYREISEQLQITEKSVDNALGRIKKKCRNDSTLIREKIS